MKFFKDDINIYTDCSTMVVSTKLGKTDLACAGFIATYKGEILHEDNSIALRTLVEANSAVGEVKALSLASTYVGWLKYKYYYNLPNVNIFSDYLSGVQCINNHLDKYINDLNNVYTQEEAVNLFINDAGLLYREKKRLGEQCQTIANAVLGIYRHPVGFFYFPAHINIDNRDPAIHKAINKFKANNNMNRQCFKDMSSSIRYKLAYSGLTYNDAIDHITRNYLVQNKNRIIDFINKTLNKDIVKSYQEYGREILIPNYDEAHSNFSPY